MSDGQSPRCCVYETTPDIIVNCRIIKNSQIASEQELTVDKSKTVLKLKTFLSRVLKIPLESLEIWKDKETEMMNDEKVMAYDLDPDDTIIIHDLRNSSEENVH